MLDGILKRKVNELFVKKGNVMSYTEFKYGITKLRLTNKDAKHIINGLSKDGVIVTDMKRKVLKKRYPNI